MKTPSRATPAAALVDVSGRFLQGKRMTFGDREDWQRLASYVVSARVAAGYKDRRALAAVTGITDRTLGTLENGRRVSPETLAAVERAVGWKPDSARLVLTGGEPVPAVDAVSRALIPDDDPVVAYVRDLPGLSPAARKALEGIARVAGLTVDERRGMVGWVLIQWEQRAAENRSA